MKDKEDEAGIKNNDRYQEAAQLSDMKTIEDNDIKKSFVRSNKNDIEEKCVFDTTRMCTVHGCEAVEMHVKVSRYRKDVGFYKETITKLKCERNRVRMPGVSDIASVQCDSDPAALDNKLLRNYDICSETRLPAKKGGNIDDWVRTNIETESRTVIGCMQNSTHTLPGEV